jgi:hypothetical protein
VGWISFTAVMNSRKRLQSRLNAASFAAEHQAEGMSQFDTYGGSPYPSIALRRKAIVRNLGSFHPTLRVQFVSEAHATNLHHCATLDSSTVRTVRRTWEKVRGTIIDVNAD